MVIILQQTLEDGQRFVSTVIEGTAGGGSEDTSFASNSFLSMNSQHSISERSAVYKQRIDSLFGRPSRLSPFLPNAESHHHHFLHTPTNNSNMVRINGKRIPPFSSPPGCSSSSSGCRGREDHDDDGVLVVGAVEQRRQRPPLPHIGIPPHHHNGYHENEEDDDDEEEEEEDSYSRITDDKGSSSSIITDSLNHRAIRNACASTNTTNVSSIRITCDTEVDTPPQPQSFIITTSPDQNYNHNNHNIGSSSDGRCCESSSVTVNHPRSSSSILISSSSPSSDNINNNNNKGAGSSNMWRNGSYAECPTNVSSEDKSLGLVSTPGGMLQFSVEYLGSIPVDGTTTSLQDLQTPLRNLYMDFLTGKNVMTGQLAITSDGIRFEAPKLRLVNPFSTIAVWAAIKFVAKGDPVPMDCAFMPLISDPEGQDKSRLFAPMDPEFGRVYLTCVAGSTNGFKNPPLFACVMREASFSLDCHAFACKCAEDAIVVAANLYQSLVDKMRSGHKEGESGYGSLNRTSPSNGIQSSPNQNNRSSSSASSTTGGQHVGVKDAGGLGGGRGRGGRIGHGHSSSSPEDIRNKNRAVFSDSESVIPIRPPRRKKKYSEIPSGNLKRYNSEDSVLLKMPHRRKSFKRNYQSKPKKRVQISTPDETSSADSLLHESSIDQVLDRIINPGGMSFNDLKPSYQDLILKIALTLTQDQLYQKSKQVMKKQQGYLRKKIKNSSSSGDVSDDNSQFLHHLLKSFSKITSKSPASASKRYSKGGCSGSGGGGGLFSKGGAGNNNTTTNNSNINIMNNNNHPIPAPRKVILKKPKDPAATSAEDATTFMSFCSGCICEKCSEKCYCSLPSKVASKLNGIIIPPTVCPNVNNNNNNNNNAVLTKPTSTSSGSTPCPLGSSCMIENKDKPRKLCGYDSESCAESEKCYCEINQIKSNGLKIYNINLDTETSDTDTNSYDLEPFNQQQGGSSSSNGKTVSTRSVEILSYHPSKRLSYNLSPAANNNLQHLQTTSAIVHFEDSLNIQSSINTQCALNSGKMSISPFCNGQKGDCPELKNKLQRDKVLLITGSSPAARVVYKDHPSQSYQQQQQQQHGPSPDGKKSRNGMHRDLIDIMEDEDCNEEDGRRSDTDTGDDGIAPEKVLSMKKTAEIAAMFTDLKLDQTTNVVPDLESSNNFESMQNAEDSTASLDFEASLGYLP